MRRPHSSHLLLLSPLLTILPATSFTPPPPSSSCHPSSTSLHLSRLLTSTTSTQPRPLATSGDWSAYLDESRGLIYYFHRRTGESTWDPPTGVEMKLELSSDVKRRMREQLRVYLQQRLDVDLLLGEQQQQQQSSAIDTKDATATTDNVVVGTMNKSPAELLADKRRSGILATHGSYIALLDEKRGMIYYHDEKNNITTWNRPEDFPFIKLSASKRKELQEQNRRYLEWRKEGTIRRKVNVLGKGVVTASSSEGESAAISEDGESIGDELSSLNQIQIDIDARLSEVKQNSPILIYKKDEWAAYLDDTSGLVYYYNEVEKKSVWDAPDAEFLEKVKERMMEDPNSFAGALEESKEREEGGLKASGLKLQQGDDVTREVIRDENGEIINGRAAGALESEEEEEEEDGLKASGLKLQQGDDVTREVIRDENGKIINSSDAVQETDESLAKAPIDYDAAVRLAYEAKWFAGEYDTFKSKYLVETSKMVASKHQERMAEAARVAAELKAAQQRQIEQEAKLARSPIDYDAAARLSYEAMGAVGEFDAFKAKYLADTSATVAEKFKSRMEAVNSDDSAIEVKEAMENDAESKPFFLLDREDGVEGVSIEAPETSARGSSVLENDVIVEEPSDEMVVDQPSANGVIEEQFEAQPQLPQDDPFARGSDVASLISPLKAETLYDILQVDISATRSDIKRSYIKLAKETHPDALLQNGIIDDKEAEMKFTDIARAYKILSDPTERRRYDRELKAKGLSRSAGSMFENWVMKTAKAMDEALAKAEQDLERNNSP